MARAKHPCLDCPRPIPAGVSRCPDCARARDRARGSRQARGYGRAYDQARRQAAPAANTGRATCWRCRLPIRPGDPWHMGHDDQDRTIIRGPEHETCNLSAAGRAAHGLPPR